MDLVTRSEEWMQATSESLKRTSLLVIPSPGPASVVFGLLQHIIRGSNGLSCLDTGSIHLNVPPLCPTALLVLHRKARFFGPKLSFL